MINAWWDLTEEEVEMFMEEVVNDYNLCTVELVFCANVCKVIVEVKDGCLVHSFTEAIRPEADLAQLHAAVNNCVKFYALSKIYTVRNSTCYPIKRMKKEDKHD